MVVVFSDFAAGLVGGSGGVIVGYPLDIIKTRLQTQSVGAVKYNGILDCAMKITRQESVFGFYKGMGFPLASVSLQSAVLFGAYGNVLRQLSAWRGEGSEQPPRKTDIFVAGWIAGIVQLTIACPIELVKIRLQMQTHRRGDSMVGQGSPTYKGPIHCISNIFKTEGIRGCYRGLTPHMMRDAPSFAIYFLGYDILCKQLTFEGQQRPSTWALLLAGGTAGCISWILVNPLDVMKNRYQADGVKHKKYHNIWHCFADSYRTGGIRVFFTGVAINCLRGFPVNAVVLGGYTLTLRVLGAERQ
ncbi:solute carrier family 25 member 45-like [Glandiceps talaboti]